MTEQLLIALSLSIVALGLGTLLLLRPVVISLQGDVVRFRKSLLYPRFDVCSSKDIVGVEVDWLQNTSRCDVILSTATIKHRVSVLYAEMNPYEIKDLLIRNGVGGLKK
ncbi:hypothetical protein [Thalassoglobus neptunius]|nr:hypothetical protein [Thalassoglobus neptunius]